MCVWSPLFLFSNFYLNKSFMLTPTLDTKVPSTSRGLTAQELSQIKARQSAAKVAARPEETLPVTTSDLTQEPGPSNADELGLSVEYWVRLAVRVRNERLDRHGGRRPAADYGHLSAEEPVRESRAAVQVRNSRSDIPARTQSTGRQEVKVTGPTRSDTRSHSQPRLKSSKVAPLSQEKPRNWNGKFNLLIRTYASVLAFSSFSNNFLIPSLSSSKPKTSKFSLSKWVT